MLIRLADKTRWRAGARWQGQVGEFAILPRSMRDSLYDQVTTATVPRLMFIQTREALAACLLNDYVLKKWLISWGPLELGGLGPGPQWPRC